MHRIITIIAVCLAWFGSAYAQSVQITSPYYVQIGQYYVDWAYPTINLSAAQSRGLTGKGVTVAVFDTGLNSSNYKFAGNLSGTSYNIYTGGTVSSDSNGHGTFVSSIIAANAQTQSSAVTMYGVASSAKLMPIQVMNSVGQGAWTDSQLANGINFAVNNGARVFNNSWGTNLMQSQVSVQTVLNQNAKTIAAYESAAARGVVTVFAAGNYGTASPDYYATLPSIDSKLAGTWLVAVATDSNGAIASYSNQCGIAKYYCLAAPGSNILGIYGSQLAIGSGTSFAAPMVAGGVALLEQQWPYLTGAQITSILLRTANKTGIYANSNIYGQGMMNLAAATAPQGTVTVPTGATVADSSVPLSQSGLSVPAAFGKLSTQGTGMMVLDDYGRAYSVSMNNMVGSAASWVNLDTQMARFGSDQTVTEVQGGWKLGLVDDANLAEHPTTPTAVPGLGNPYLSMGMDPKMVMSTANITTWFSTHTYSASDDQSLQGSTTQPSIVGGLYRWRDLQIGITHESNSIYGQQVAAGSSMATGADTAFVALSHSWDLGEGLAVDLSGSLGYSRLTGVNQLVSSISNVTLSSGAVGFSKTSVFRDSDRLGMVVSIPNHTVSGTAAFNLPVSRDMDGNISYQDQKLNLVGTGTETDIQAYWSNQFAPGNKLNIAVGVRVQPEGNADAAPDSIAMLRWNLAF